MPPPKKKNSFMISAGVSIAVLFFMLGLYHVPLQSKFFYFDDNSSIVENQAIKTLDIPKIFHAFNSRFLAGLSFALNYQWCGLNPEGFRLVNLLIHCLNGLLVYLLIRITLKSFGLRPQDDKKLNWPAFFAATLFLCHPIQTEPVNFITQRFVLMGSFFYLLTMYLYIQYRCGSNKAYLIAGFGSAIAAMFCKEFVVTLPVMLILYEFYFLGARGEAWQKRCNRIVPFLAIALIVPILLLRTPPEVIGVANIANADSMDHVDITRAYGDIGRKQYFLTELNVMCTYVRLLFFPVNQDLDYDYPIAHGLDGKTALCGVFLICLLALAAVTYRPYRLISFGILWFFIALSVESSFIPIGHVIAEYRVYLASIGFVIIVMSILYSLPIGPPKLNMIAAGVLAVFSILTYQRNDVWKNEISLWGDAVQKSPHKARPRYNLGYAYFNQGRSAEALADYNKAINMNPDYLEVYLNRGIIYFEEGDLTQALGDFNKALQLNPHVAEAYYNRGNVYTKENNFIQALSDYNKAIASNPGYAEAYSNRGSIYAKQGNFSQALISYNKAIEIYLRVLFPTGLNIWADGIRTNSIGKLFKSHYTGFADAYYNRGCVYDQMGYWDRALSDYSMAIELNPDYADAYNNRGHVYSRQGRYAQALSDYDKAIDINPDTAGYYYNRAISYYESREYGNALADARKAEGSGAAMNPDFLRALAQALK